MEVSLMMFSCEIVMTVRGEVEYEELGIVIGCCS